VWCVNASSTLKDLSNSPPIWRPVHRNAPSAGQLTTYALLGVKVANVEVVGVRAGDVLDRAHRQGLERASQWASSRSTRPPRQGRRRRTEALRANVGGIFVPTVREDAVGAIVGRYRDGQDPRPAPLAELQVFTAPTNEQR
jgi:hypothetical protein